MTLEKIQKSATSFTFKSISQQLLYLDQPYFVCSWVLVGTCQSAICHLTLTSFSWLSDFAIFLHISPFLNDCQT